jgi:hypothetical protein
MSYESQLLDFSAVPNYANHTMEEQEMPLIQISVDDIRDANQLSLHCPICSNAVENNLNGDLTPIVCLQCGTLYHKTCWDQGGGKCAVLGCGHDKYRVFGRAIGPALKVKYSDIPAGPGRNGSGPSRRTKRLKDQQRRQVEQLRRPSLLQRLWQWILDQIKFE